MNSNSLYSARRLDKFVSNSECRVRELETLCQCLQEQGNRVLLEVCLWHHQEADLPKKSVKIFLVDKGRTNQEHQIKNGLELYDNKHVQ